MGGPTIFTQQRVPANEKGKLDPYTASVASQYMDAESIKTLQEVNTKYGAEPTSHDIQDHGRLFNLLRMNPSPVTAENHKLYSNIQTQQIFGPNDYILSDRYQYIITYPVTKKEIESWVAELRNMHNKTAQTPIIFEYQLLPDFWNGNPQYEIMTEAPNALFKIKKYYIDTNTSQWTLENHYNKHHLRNLGKPIVFKEINTILEDRGDAYLKDILESARAKAQLYSFRETYMDYEIYCKLVQKYPAIDNPNLVFPNVNISGQSPEDQREQLKVLLMDKRVFNIRLKYDLQNHISSEFWGNIKANGELTFNPSLLQKPRSIAFCGLNSGMQIGNRKIYSFYSWKYKNDIVSKKVREYVQYVQDNNLEYLSGFVNFANKPSYLTDKEWRKVIVLTGMVEEIMDFVDQKFNEYEANPYAGPAADPYGCGGNYGCDGYGCAGYNPYRQYYYGYGC